MPRRIISRRITQLCILGVVCICLYTGSMFLVDQLYLYVEGPVPVAEPSTEEGAQWSQWHGPNRDNRSTETGLLKTWPVNGPRLVWKCDGLGKGWSSPTIANARIFVTGAEKKKEHLVCLDLNGKMKWKIAYGSVAALYSGARSTPAFDSGFIYVISGIGEVVCINTKKEMVEWKLNGYKIFGGKSHHFGTAESPLVYDGKVFYTPCGQRTSMVAFDKLTGEVVWESPSLDDESAYVSPLVIRRGKNDIILTVTGMHIIGVHPQTGEFLWKYPYVEKHMTRNKTNTLVQNAVTPIYFDGQIYVTSGYNHVGVTLQLSDDGRQVTLLWQDKTLDCHHGGVILHNGYIYGSSWHSNLKGGWVCLDWETGQVMYDHIWYNKGSILYADEMLYCYEEKKGHIALVRPTPKAFDIVSSFQITMGSGEHWAHPVLCDGRLYIRRGDSLMVYDVKDH